ncbi:mechanosensitive ion channel family protein [Flavobacterium haoranii]|uniref:Small conductance mechanosensitive channel n=1 Tax=Flavobacterium haoranii TaxID=683124 RepID=A0A1M6FV47_9FLAO|nr:mechanosensitive ion channel domain-containing protein [Flavobacterium haoranii]SHJ01575.1 small conductance mechanosensitive channel [Flavobacterium haoranii]
MYPEKIENYFELIKNLLIEYSPKVITALILLFVGLWVVSIITKAFKKIMVKKEVEITLANFLGNIVFWTLRVLLFVIVISKLGFETSSLVAILGAAGLAIGLALQGSLSNFAGGVLIILFKPFKVNDVIEAQGEIGTVQEIQIFNTRLLTANNQTIYIPNGILSNGIIKNYTQEGIRRADLNIGIAYNSDIRKAKEVIMEVLNNHPKILTEPAPSVIVKELADSAINLGIRPWSKSEDFLEVSSETLIECKLALDKVNISIPFPQRELRIINEDK